MTRRSPVAAAIVASALFTRSAVADEQAEQTPASTPAQTTPPQTTPPPLPPNEVVITGTRTAESGRRATVRTDVVTREEAERRGAADIGEALQGQLGVQVNPSAYGYLGNPSAIQIQGFDRDRVLILEDGERIVGDVGGAIDLSTIPLTDVSRIELVTGPTSSLYGTSAIGGVVNILTAPPEVEGLSGRARIEGRSRWGLLLQGSSAYRKDDTWAGVDASFQRSDGVALSDAVPDLVLPESARRLIGLRVGTRVGDRIELRLRARWIHDDLTGLESQVVPGLKTYLVDLPERTDRFTLHFSESIDVSERLNLRLMLGRQWFDGTTAKDRRDSPADETRARSDVMQSIEAVATLTEGARAWTFGARAEAEYFAQELTRTLPSQGTLVTTESLEVPRTELGSGALYGQLSWKLTDSLTVLAGARGELHLGYGGVFAPRLAAAFTPSPEWIVRASVGRGFRAPSAKEFGFVFDHSYYGYRVTGNPDLVPETSWGVNGDVSFTPKRRLTLRLGGFVNWIEQLIDIDIDPTLSAGGIADYMYRNIGEARTAGFQADAAWRVSPSLRVEAGYAYLWTRDDTNQRPLEGRPPHTLYTSALVTLPWSLELYARWRGVTDAFIDETVRSPGFSQLDLRLARALWPRAQVYAGATNILDVQKDPSRLGDQRPITGRTIYIGLRSEYPWGDE